MKKKLLAIGAITVTACSLTACGEYSDSATDNSAASAPVTSDPVTDLLDANYAKSAKMCVLIDSLVNQGWTNDEIYGQLSDGGAFDGLSGGTAEDSWHKLTRWCAANPH